MKNGFAPGGPTIQAKCHSAVNQWARLTEANDGLSLRDCHICVSVRPSVRPRLIVS